MAHQSRYSRPLPRAVGYAGLFKMVATEDSNRCHAIITPEMGGEILVKANVFVGIRPTTEEYRDITQALMDEWIGVRGRA